MRLVVAGTLAAAALAAAAPLQGQDVGIRLAPNEVLLNVEAEGVHRSRPDLMTVTAGVVTTGSTAREALASNSELASRLVAAVRARGVDPRDVQTAELSVNPRFDENDRRVDGDRRARILGYVARNRLTLRLRDLSKAPEIIDSLFAVGANQVEGPQFGLSEPAPALKLARREAVRAALEEASTYAEALNMRVSRVLRVSERGEFEAGRGDAIVVTGGRVAATPVEPGEIESRTRVWIDYALVPNG